MALAETIRAERIGARVRYLQTRDAKGMHAFYFYMPGPGRESYLERAAGNPGLYNLADMGEILYAGFGKKPSARDIQAIETKLNIRVAALFPQLVA